MSTKTIIKEQFIRATQERVFQAFTQKEELERWFVPSVEIELKPEGIFRMEWVPGMGEHGRVKDVKPSQLLRYTWEGAFSPTPTTLTFEFTPEKEGTLVTLTHS